MKTCQVCNNVKDESEFYKHKTRPDGLRANCIECGKKQAREIYHKNPEKYIARAKKHRFKIRNKRKIWLQDIKLQYGCQICKEKSIEVLDFHHMDSSKKEYNIMEVSGKGIKKVINEINKCIILCANCHRKVHAKTKSVDSSMLCSIPLPIKRSDGKLFHYDCLSTTSTELRRV